jgi:hypothetical protein
MENIGRIILILGIVIALVGGILMLITRIFPGLSNLPGIRIEIGPFTCLFPIAASIILSIILTIVLNIVLRMMSR